MVRGISSNFGVMSLAVLLPLALSCFITNCPPGGKRSNLPPLNQENSAILRRCAKCGPNLAGRCFGARVCCSDKLGCIVGSSEAATAAPSSLSLLPCVAESLFPKLCSNGHLSSCGKGAKGVCAAPGVCCLKNSCHADSNCSRKQGSSSSIIREQSENMIKDEDTQEIFEVVEIPGEEYSN